MTPEDFIRLIKEPALDCEQKDHIPASFTIAQAALESGWGESQLTRAACNLFGLKAGPEWTGERTRITTKEYVNGSPVMVEAWFRKYPNWQACIDDHAKVLKEPRYAAAFKTGSGVTFGYAIAQAGYATDPNYGAKLARVILTHGLASFDATSPDPPATNTPKESSMEKLLSLWRFFKAGEAVANPALWKKGAITVTLLSPVILKLSNVLQAFGLHVAITDEQSALLAGGIVAATNIVVHFVANPDVGFRS